MTPELREKLALHSLALALLLKRGRLSTAALAADLGLTESKCAFYLKQLGCKIERKSGSPNLAVLQLPLTFPKVSRGPVQRS